MITLTMSLKSFCRFFLIVNTIIIIAMNYKCYAYDTIPDHTRLVFYYEILNCVEQPLAFETWIRLGGSLQLDKASYTEWTESMERFYQASIKRTLLTSATSFFGLLVRSHQIEAEGLYHFLIKTVSWENFVRNACWARQHTHPHIFVYAFTRAISERGFHRELLPFIYEIIPRHFFDWQIVELSSQFEPSKWSSVQTRSSCSISTKSINNWWSPWQWWKNIGYGDLCWYKQEKQDGDHDLWWIPNDYTRNMPNHHQRHSVLSYLTEDADWNAYWYLVCTNFSPLIGGFTNSWNADLFGQHWLFFLEKFLSRYYMERLSHGFGEILDLDWNHIHTNVYAYDPELVAINGRKFDARSNEDSHHRIAENKRIRETLVYIKAIIDAGNYTLRNGSIIDLREQNSIGHIMVLLLGHTDPNGNFIESHWYSLAHAHFANIQSRSHQNVKAHTMLNFETMARDPFFYVFHNEIAKLGYRLQSYMTPYNTSDLHINGVGILDANVSKLVTYDEIFDYDVTNLMSRQTDKWRLNLFARRARLNHRPFNFNVTIKSDQHRSILLRLYIAPKFDEFGRKIPLDRNRRYFIELTNIKLAVRPGINVLQYNYEEIFVRKPKDNYFPSKMHHCAISSDCQTLLKAFIEDNKNCGLHDRLLLPRGWSNGMPMQIFVMATEIETISTQLWWRPCVIHVARRSLGFPFDRPIPSNFMGANMLLKDVKIFHEDGFANLPKKDRKVVLLRKASTLGESYRY